MKKTLSLIIPMLLLFLVATPASAEVKFGLRGGYNITKLTFSSADLSTANRSGYFIGPTVKIDLPLGLDIDASALYNHTGVETDYYATSPTTIERVDLSRNSLALPINLRKGFGMGDTASFFVFVGPQFDFLLNGDKDIADSKWTWKSSAISINVGAGVMLMNHVEVRANYNIPCGTTGSFTFDKTASNAKTGTWQIGLAYYF